MLALVLGSQPASAGKKRSKPSEARERSSDSDEDSEDSPPPKKKPEKPAKPAKSEKPLPARPAVSSGSGLPAWTEGLGWTVKSVYRKGDAEPAEWSEPTFWSFRVKKVKQQGKVTKYLLHAQVQDGTRADTASLVLTRYPLAGADVLSMNRTTTLVGVRGTDKPLKSMRQLVAVGAVPHPVLVDDSAIPYDFPALPFLPRSTGAGTKENDLSRSFQFVEDIDDQKRPGEIAQIEHQSTPVETFAGKELVEYIKGKGWAAADLSLAEFRRKGGAAVKQVWSSKLPWYIYSETPSSRSWLWDIDSKPAETPSPAPSPAASSSFQ